MMPKALAGEFENIWAWLIVALQLRYGWKQEFNGAVNAYGRRGYDKQFAAYVRFRTEPMELEGENSIYPRQPSEKRR
jgi:hypothetical protein